MSKYKVGDKFIVEIQNLYNREFPPSTTQLYQLDGFCNALVDEDDLDKLQKLNPQLKIEDIEDIVAIHDRRKEAYQDGLADAWELARKISHMCLDDMNKCFDLEDLDKYGADMMLYEHYTPQEALAKIEAYEKSQQIQVGDVVRFKDSKTEVLITSVARGLNGIHIQTDEYGKVGEVNSGICREYVEKTGKHLDIEHLLEQIRGNE